MTDKQAQADALGVLAEERDRLRREYNCASIRAACYLGDAVLASFGVCEHAYDPEGINAAIRKQLAQPECPACNGDKVIPAHSSTDSDMRACPLCGGRGGVHRGIMK